MPTQGETRSEPGTEQRAPAGLLARSCAGILDLALVALVVVVVAEILAGTERYLPIEISVVIAYALYTSLAVAIWGKTLGGWISGVHTTSLQNQKLSPVRAGIRAAAVAFSQLLLFLPFLVLLGRRRKRGWHDLLAGSRVTVNPASYRQKRIRAAVLIVPGMLLSIWFVRTAIQYHNYRRWNRDADGAGFSLLSDTGQAVTVQSLSVAQRDQITQWLSANAIDPCEYLINTAATHQVTLVGEVHGVRQNLEFFNRVIPALYHRAGVRVIALECLSDTQDGDVNELITAHEFDRGLFLRIARGHCWPTWGYRNHWRVLETVWQLNQTVPAEERMRVVGIMPALDLVSFHMVKYGPWWEKLRLVRMLPGAPALFTHDAHYARCTERAAFGPLGARTLVWVGNAHTPLTFTGRTVRDGDASSHTYRMGAMLAGRYGNQIAQVVLHNSLNCPGLVPLIESGLAATDRPRAGFDIAGSPLAPILDETSPLWLRRDDCWLCFEDMARGYIVLAPADQLEQDAWWQGFISARMFGRYRPFYEAVTEQALVDHLDAERRIYLAYQNF